MTAEGIDPDAPASGGSRRRRIRTVPNLVRHAGIYTVSQLVSRSIPFLLLPVLTRYLSPSDYGIVAMLLLVTTVLEPFVSLGFAGALTVRFYDRAIDLGAFISTGLGLVAGIALPVGVLVWFVRGPLSDVTQVPSDWLLVAVPLIVLRSIAATVLALIRVREQPALFALFTNMQSATLLGLAVLLVVALGSDWRGRIEAEVIAAAVFAVLGLLWLRNQRLLRARFQPAYARQIARFGIPLIPHTVGAVLMLQTDRLLVTNLVGVSETGLYTVGYQLAVVVEVVAMSFNFAYTPWLFRKLRDVTPAVRARLVRITYVQFAGMGALALAVAVGVPPLVELILGRSFAGSARYVGWFAIAFLFSGMYYMVTNYIFFAQKTSWLAAVTISVAVVNIPITYVLTVQNGGIGAAQATAISYGLSFVCTWLVSQRVYPMPWLAGLPFRRTPPLTGGDPSSVDNDPRT